MSTSTYMLQALPEEVEHTDQAVLAADGCTALGIGRGSAEGIDGHEGAARDLLLVICHCETPFGVIFGFSRGIPAPILYLCGGILSMRFREFVPKTYRKAGKTRQNILYK